MARFLRIRRIVSRREIGRSIGQYQRQICPASLLKQQESSSRMQQIASIVAATERCVFTTAGGIKPLPEKEIVT